MKFSLISAVALALLCPLAAGQQELKIWAYDGSWYDRYGGAVALDGERAIVGARWATTPETDPELPTSTMPSPEPIS